LVVAVLEHPRTIPTGPLGHNPAFTPSWPLVALQAWLLVRASTVRLLALPQRLRTESTVVMVLLVLMVAALVLTVALRGLMTQQ
jgi:hypothetical protein